VIAGRLTADCEVNYVSTGTAKGTFTLAVDRPKFGDREKVTDFIPCVLWGKRAEALGQYLVKGKPIAVTGAMQIDTWEKDGQKHRKAYILVNDVRFLPDGKGNGNNNQQQQGNNSFATEIPFSESEIPF
jgi:single-strand DNA-binding protein